MLAAKVIFEILERLLEVKNIEKEKKTNKKNKRIPMIKPKVF